MSGQTSPLAGIRVVDFSELLPGPFMTQMLVEMGAEVIKVERPAGDLGRHVSPAGFAASNRGKTSVVADLKNAQDRERVLALCRKADVVVETFRPGVMRRLGLDYEALRGDSPKLVYLSLTGFGQTGPMASVPGHDLNFLAAGGAIALSGRLGDAPAQAFGLPVGDLAGSMYALAALVTALFQRAATGQGQYLDVSITDCIAHWGNTRTAHFVENGLQSLSAQRSDVLRKPAYGVFLTSDGKYMSIGALEDAFWKRLVRVLDLHAWAGEKYATYHGRLAEAEAINEALAQAAARCSSEALANSLRQADVPFAVVVEPLEFAVGAHAKDRQLCITTDVGSLLRFPVRMSGMPPTPCETTQLGRDSTVV